MPDNDLCHTPETSGNDGATVGPPPDGKSPRPGAPVGNLHNFRHGARSRRRLFPVCGLGERFVSVNQYVGKLVRRLETRVVETYGAITEGTASDISEAASWEVCRQLALRRIASGESTDVVGDSRVSAYAAGQRNRCIRRLGLEDERRSTPSAWDEVDKLLAAEADQSHQDVDQDDFDGDGTDTDQGGERTADGDVGDQVADGEDVWSEADAELERSREAEGG